MANSVLQPSKDVADVVYAENCVEWVLCRAVCAVMGLRFSPISWHLVAENCLHRAWLAELPEPTEWLQFSRPMHVHYNICVPSKCVVSSFNVQPGPEAFRLLKSGFNGINVRWGPGTRGGLG